MDDQEIMDKIDRLENCALLIKDAAGEERRDDLIEEADALVAEVLELIGSVENRDILRHAFEIFNLYQRNRDASESEKSAEKSDGKPAAKPEDDEEQEKDEQEDDEAEYEEQEDECSAREYRVGKKGVRLSPRTHDMLKKLLSLHNMCARGKRISIQHAVMTALLKFFEREYDDDGNACAFRYYRAPSVIGRNAAYRYAFLPDSVHEMLAAYCSEAGCTYTQAAEVAVLLYCEKLAKKTGEEISYYVMNYVDRKRRFK